MDVDFEERVKGKRYHCNECEEKFMSVSKHPMCPSCGSDDVSEE